MSTVRVRAMNGDDAGRVQQVARAAWNHTYEGVIPLAIQETFHARHYSDEAMRSRLANSAMYVAERDGDIVGFANFQRSRTVPEEAELTAIYLLPEAQGMGIGTLLLNAGVRELDGVKRLIADVERHNASGLRFYRARGFKTVGEHEATLNGYALPMARMCLSINNH